VKGLGPYIVILVVLIIIQYCRYPSGIITIKLIIPIIIISVIASKSKHARQQQKNVALLVSLPVRVSCLLAGIRTD
jgi:ABC-type transport system involved in cytochrome bd biosynthesis fused ATPase/permease subunit